MSTSMKPYAERSFDLHGLDGISDAQIGEHLALYAGSSPARHSASPGAE
jgi:hypothetical protein